MSVRGRPRTTIYPYISSTGKLKEFFENMKDRSIPPLVNQQYLIQNGFAIAAEYDNMTRILKDLKLIDDNKVPNRNYLKYVNYVHDATRRKFLQLLVKRTYSDLFDLHQDAWRRETRILKKFFDRAHRSRSVRRDAIRLMITTFRCLCTLCDFQEENPDIVKIVRKLDGLSNVITVEQEDQFLQSISCLDNEAYRASIVLAWTALADYMRHYLNTDIFVQLKNLGTKKHGRSDVHWGKVVDIDDLLENYSDFQIIEAIKLTYRSATSSNIGAVYSRLDTLRKRRNSSAHPESQGPERVEAVSYITECLKAIAKLSEKKMNQFP